MSTIVRQKISVNGVGLSYLEAGAENERMILFLHGFPESSASWTSYLEYFSKAGYHVLAPDQRGYNESESPSRISDYKLDSLTADMVAFINHFPKKEVYVVAHDWGGIVAWALAAFHPQLFSKMIILNVPHWLCFKKSLFTSAQFFKSWYILIFRIKPLAEKLLALNDYAFFIDSLKKSSRYKLSDELLASYKRFWPSKMTSMLNWYRALDPFDNSGSAIKIKTPILFLLGEKDPFINLATAKKSAEYCENCDVEVIPGVAHFIQHEARPKLISLIEEQFQTDKKSQLR